MLSKKSRSRSVMVLSVLLLVLTLKGAEPAQASSIVGAWTRVYHCDDTGKIIQPPESPAFVIYSADGFFAQMELPPGRPKNDKEVGEMSKEELVARFDNVDALRGRYTIVGTRLAREVIARIDPAGEGKEIVQVMRLAGDTLILNSTKPGDKTEARFVRVR